MKSAIIIPARYGSTRFPGKPLAMIAGKTMLNRVCEIASHSASIIGNCEVLVATESDLIFNHANDLGYKAVVTSDNCRTGSDRVLEALSSLKERPDFILNLQGDAPLTPPDFLTSILSEFKSNQDLEIVTPVIKLKWSELDSLREQKKITPFSGTTAIIDKDNYAIWFSKNIIPAIRPEEQLRSESELSPINKHVGLYGFRTDILEEFVKLDAGHYENLEGLEQLRLLENGYRIKSVPVTYKKHPSSSGVDSKEDVQIAEDIINKYGELL